MTRVALIFGGRSPEHEVSIVSARNVTELLRQAGFEVVLAGVGLDGTWCIGDDAAAQLCRALETSTPLAQLGGIPGSQALGRLAVDIVFPLIHGVYGEDASLQGLCTMLDLPFVGGGSLNMSLTWDKITCRQVLRDAGLPQLPMVVVNRFAFDLETTVSQVEAQFAYPVFIKPSRTGSSIGISRALDRQQLEAGLSEALQYDYRVLVEPGLTQVMEVEIAGLGCSQPMFSIPGQLIPENDFYDFEEKYLKSTTRFVVPAPLTQAQRETLEAHALQAWRALDCYGMARIDFLIAQDQVYLNEVNTVPGFTEISMYPRLLRDSGVDGVVLMKRLIDLGLRRQELVGRKLAFFSRQNWFNKGKE